MSDRVHVHRTPVYGISVFTGRCYSEAGCDGGRAQFALLSYGPRSYYGPSVICMQCGERWEDGQMMPRPFKRGWREENVHKAQVTLDEALARAAKARAELEADS